MLNHLYESSQFKNILIDVDGVYIPFDRNWKNIGIAVSGGADSALLCYLLADIIDKNKCNTNIHIISNIRMWKKRPWQKYNSLDVYKFLQNKFRGLNFFRHENFIPPELEWGDKGPTIVDEYGQLVSGDIVELRSFAEFIGHTESLDCYYNAVTKNPKVKFNGAPPKRDLDPSKENFYLTVGIHMNRVSSHPFRFVDKAWIYKQYTRLKILDLFEITRSCEGNIENLDFTNYKPGQYVPICGQCFWCKEREWAIEQAN